MNYRDAIWIEKYRPKVIADLVLPQRFINLYNNIKKSNNLPNLLLTGNPGTGKTSSARVLCNELGIEYEILNSSKDRGIDIIRNFVNRYAQTSSSNGKYKCLILDECDGLTTNSMESLRNIIEESSNNLRFICTANFPQQIIDPLKSRLQTIDFNFNINDKKEMAPILFKRLLRILREEDISITDKSILGHLMKNYMPDVRHIIKILQTYSLQNDGVIDDGILTMTSDMDFMSFTAFIKSSEYNDLLKYSYECSPEAVFRTISDGLEKLDISFEKQLEIINLVSHFDSSQSRVMLKEVNVLAFLMNLKKYL